MEIELQKLIAVTCILIIGYIYDKEGFSPQLSISDIIYSIIKISVLIIATVYFLQFFGVLNV